MAYETGHCLNTILSGRPSTAPAQKTLRERGSGAVDDAKLTWDRIRFGQETQTFKGIFVIVARLYCMVGLK